MAQGYLEDIECRLATVESLLRMRYDGTSVVDAIEERIEAVEEDQKAIEGALHWTEDQRIVQRIEALERRIEDLADRDGLSEHQADVDVRVERLEQLIKGVARITDIETLEKLLRLASDRYEELAQRIAALEPRVPHDPDSFMGILHDPEEDAAWKDLDASTVKESLTVDQEDDTEPLPCPACNPGYRSVFVVEAPSVGTSQVVCSSCGFSGRRKGAKADAVAAWNELCRDAERGRECAHLEAERDEAREELATAKQARDHWRQDFYATSRLLASANRERDELAKIVRDVASSQPGMVPIKAMYLAREWVKKQGDE